MAVNEAGSRNRQKSLTSMASAFLNVGLRAFPDTGYRAARSLTWLRPPAADDARMNDPRVRVVTPWTAMIVGLLILTIVVNVVLWVA
jgi:hypothetical protein